MVEENRKQDFANWTAGPAGLGNADAARLEQLIAEYPYAQLLHYFKARISTADADIRKAALYATDRSVLYTLLHQPESLNTLPATLPEPFIGLPEAGEENYLQTGQQPEAGPAEDPDEFFVESEIQEVQAPAEQPDEPAPDEDEFLVESEIQEVPMPEAAEEKEQHLENHSAIEELTGTDEEVQPAVETIDHEDRDEFMVESEIQEVSVPEAEEPAVPAPADEPPHQPVDEAIDEERDEFFVESEIQEVSMPETAEEAAYVSAAAEPVIEGIEEVADEQPAENVQPAFSPSEEKELIGEIASADYFTFEEKRQDPPAPLAEEPAKDTQELSRYDDDTMPFTFLWWLNKTREDHAANLQPYSAPAPKQAKAASAEKKTPDELDKQIVEHIFHLQSPAEEVPGAKTVEFDLKKKEEQLIEKFIKEEPQIGAPEPNKIDSENKARTSSEDRHDLVSETLAQIYTEQMLFHKAIDTYKKLSLKFPEKKLYFADQIEKLEKRTN